MRPKIAQRIGNAAAAWIFAELSLEAQNWAHRFFTHVFNARDFELIRFATARQLHAPLIAIPAASQAHVLEPIDSVVRNADESGFQRAKEIVMFEAECDRAERAPRQFGER